MNNNYQKLSAMVGMCAKARKLIYGIPLICSALKASSHVKLVLYSHSASQNSKKRITNKCLYYNIQAIEIPLDTVELAGYTGKSGAVAAVGITDAGLARAVLGLIPKEQFACPENLIRQPTAPFIDEERN